MSATLANIVARSHYGNLRYLYDVLGLLSHCILKRCGNPQNVALPAWSDRTKAIDPSDFDTNMLTTLARAFLYNNGQKRRISQRLVFACGIPLWNKLTFSQEDYVVSDKVRARYETIFGPSGIAKECTFKTHGDFIIHTMLQIRDIGSHCASALIKGDNIFGDVARAYGSRANGVVRQYLDKSPVDFIKPGRQTDEVQRFITTACVLMEVCNDINTVLLRDREILKKDNQTPQLFITADAPPYEGRAIFVYTDGKHCFTFKTTIEAIVAYAERANDAAIASMHQIYTALFDPTQLPTQSMLQNYVSSLE